MKKRLSLLFFACLLAGCASYRPIVDMEGVNPEQYERDLKACQEYAQQVGVAGETATGSAVGAAVGGAISAVAGWDVGRGAGVGAVTGVASGGSSAASGQKQVINRCMTGRGYRVLR